MKTSWHLGLLKTDSFSQLVAPCSQQGPPEEVEEIVSPSVRLSPALAILAALTSSLQVPETYKAQRKSSMSTKALHRLLALGSGHGRNPKDAAFQADSLG